MHRDAKRGPARLYRRPCAGLPAGSHSHIGPRSPEEDGAGAGSDGFNRMPRGGGADADDDGGGGAGAGAASARG